MASFDREVELKASGSDMIVGVDEAGRGPLAGPVVAAACSLRDVATMKEDYPLWNFVRDSKTVPEKKRDLVYDFICEKYYIGVGIIEAQRIDEINILQATFEAMRKAVHVLETSYDDVFKNKKTMILVDGNAIIPILEKEQNTVTRGDSKVKCIAAASIIAKVTRDKIMLEQSKAYPQYGFEKHKGYGTKVHMEALAKYGATPIHRLSFGPVKNTFKA